MLGMTVKEDDGYQFESGLYYALGDDGIAVQEVSEDSEWNIHWVQSGDGKNHELTLRDATIEDSLFVPGNTTIHVLGDCSITAPDAAVQVRTIDGGNVAIDISGSLTLHCPQNAVFNCGDSNDGSGGSISIGSTTGGTFTCEEATSSSTITATGAVSFTGSVKASIASTAREAALSTSSKQPIVISDTASVAVDGVVSSNGDLRLEDSSSLSVVSQKNASSTVSFGHRAKCVVEQGASLDIDTQDRGLSSFNGSVDIAGSVHLKAGATTKVPGISLGTTNDYNYGGAGVINVTGQLTISRGYYGIVNPYGSVNVTEGGKVSISGVQTAFRFRCGGSIVVDGATVEVEDTVTAVESTMEANDQIIPFAFTVKNGSDVKLSSSGFVFDDAAPKGKPVMSFEFSDSTVELTSGADALATVAQNVPLPLKMEYTKSCNAFAGESAEAAEKLPVEELSMAEVSYLSIVPVGKDWTQDAHEWSSAWSSNDTHHWHACESSFCTLGDDITLMGSYAEHAFGTYQPNGDATCDEDGTETSSCACGKTHTRTDADSALGHDFGAWTVVKEATCTDAGEEQRSCSRCDAVEHRAIDVADHSFKDGACTVCGMKDPSYKPAAKPGAPADLGGQNDQSEQLPKTGDPAGALFVALSGAGCLGAGAFASRRRRR